MSGTHMAESCTPWNRSGGKVIGTRSTALNTPDSPSTVQNGLLLRSVSTLGLVSGMR